MRLRNGLSGAIVGVFCLATPAFADKAILVLDGSGSMWGQVDGRPKIEIAKETVNNLMTGWPAGTELGIIAYGHREKANCRDIETLVPIGPVNSAMIKSTLAALNPKGKTPITAALHQAALELRSTEEKATVVLVSDGLETCEADPCAAAADLESAGIDFTVHVVGFGTTEDENRQLRCLSDNTGGKFLGAANAGELQAAMTEVKAEVVAEAAAGTDASSAENGTDVEYGIDRPGSDIATGFDLPVDDHNLCRQACLDEAQCVAWTYVRRGHQGPFPRCWVKNKVPAKRDASCCVSGVK